MKSSELIRSAVDQHLKHSMSDVGTRFMCWCIVKHQNPMVDFETLESRNLYFWIDRLPTQSKMICDILDEDVDYDILYSDFPSYEEAQDVRFMYSEFLALYFEDLGD